MGYVVFFVCTSKYEIKEELEERKGSYHIIHERRCEGTGREAIKYL